MDPFEAMLITSSKCVITQKLKSCQYQLEICEGKAFLSSTNRKVVCIFNEQVLEKERSDYSIHLGQDFYNNLHQETRNLAMRTVVRTVFERVSTQPEQSDKPALQQEDIITPHVCKLSTHQFQLLKILISDDTKGVYLNTDHQAITSYDGTCSYVPDIFDSFTICPTIIRLTNFKQINEQWRGIDSLRRK